MLARLRMRLETDRADFGYYQSSNLQGVLMEKMDSAYAEKLHEQGLKPYSQYVLGGERKEWVVSTCSREAYEKIIAPLADPSFTEFLLDQKDMRLKITAKELKTESKQGLMEEFYADHCSRYCNLAFLTPTSFKSNGKYVIMPDARYIFQSLMNKYSASSADLEMFDEETLEHLVNGSYIVRYRLRSASFPLEGVKIPSFMGEICLKVNGTDTMARYVRLLARFGEYAGIGIKTAMGMGGLKIKEEGKTND